MFGINHNCLVAVVAFAVLLTSPTTSAFVENIHTKTSFLTTSSKKIAKQLPHKNYNKSRQTITKPLQMSIPTALDTLTSGFASIARLQYGVTISDNINPDKSSAPRLFKLYDVENSVDCRAVRERITELDLEVEVLIPSAPNSRVFKDGMYQYYLSGDDKEVPRLEVMEPTEGSSTGESKILIGREDILSYLDEKFTDPVRTTPASSQQDDAPNMLQDLISEVTLYLPSLLRFTRGKSVCSAALLTKRYTVPPRPSQPLILYSYEGNQFCRLVREVLTELDLPYTLKSAGKLSPRRNELASITGGSTQCPYILDPNTNVQMAESKDIIVYLYQTYALWTPPNELIRFVSDNIMSPIIGPLFKKISPIQAGSNREDKSEYEKELNIAINDIQNDLSDAKSDIVMYTYQLSPFCKEAKTLLENLNIPYQEISLGYEWIPGLIKENGATKREALNQMTGQSSLPHIFIRGKSLGGMFSGTPGLVPSLEDGTFFDLVGDDGAQMKDKAAAGGAKASFKESLGIAAAGSTGSTTGGEMNDADAKNKE